MVRLMDRPIALTIDAAIASSDGQAALADAGGEATISYARLHDVTERIGRQLTTAGVGPGDVVAMSLPNRPAVVLAFLGVLRSGAAAAPLNPAYTRRELDAYLDALAPAAMLVPPGEAA